MSESWSSAVAVVPVSSTVDQPACLSEEIMLDNLPHVYQFRFPSRTTNAKAKERWREEKKQTSARPPCDPLP
ncbi:hypothetical protein T439DRAFT_330091 [Meredithblackwellia eburnea MCA 4105]